jgi:hypothetical protein
VRLSCLMFIIWLVLLRVLLHRHLHHFSPFSNHLATRCGRTWA